MAVDREICRMKRSFVGVERMCRSFRRRSMVVIITFSFVLFFYDIV